MILICHINNRLFSEIKTIAKENNFEIIEENFVFPHLYIKNDMIIFNIEEMWGIENNFIHTNSLIEISKVINLLTLRNRNFKKILE